MKHQWKEWEIVLYSDPPQKASCATCGAVRDEKHTGSGEYIGHPNVDADCPGMRQSLVETAPQ